MMQRIDNPPTISGEPFARNNVIFSSSVGQMSQFVYEYLDAPVSAKEVISDCGRIGTKSPGLNFANFSKNANETHFRYMMGPWIKEWVEVYNSYFDETGADVII